MRDKQQSWCFRIDQEIRFSNVSLFVTLTYDDDHLIWGTNEAIPYKRHLQLHFKQLRKQLEPRSLKYYAVAEFGDHGNRPHFHYILFYSGNMDRFKLMQLIKSKWPHGIETRVYPVSGAQGYVTKYILKFDQRDHEVPPYSMISHGIGLGYLSPAMIKYHRDNLLSFATKPGGYRISLPRYYKDKIFTQLDKLIMKKRADLYRRDLELKRLANIDFQFDHGLNPFAKQITNYQLRLYNAMKIYKDKKKL